MPRQDGWNGLRERSPDPFSPSEPVEARELVKVVRRRRVTGERGAAVGSVTLARAPSKKGRVSVLLRWIVGMHTTLEGVVASRVDGWRQLGWLSSAVASAWPCCPFFLTTISVLRPFFSFISGCDHL